ncbi:MAG: S8 family serine peptidase [Candidatus Coatesbacteria bacterium]
MPTPRRGLAAVSLGGTLYAIGGNDRWGPSSSVYAYDSATGAWSTAPSLNVAREGIGGVVLGGTIYAIGGNDGTGVVSTVEVWDGSATYWTVSSSLPTARSWLGVVTDGSSIFAVGGEDADALPVGKDGRYDPASGTWVEFNLADPTSRGLGAGWRDSDGIGHWALIGGKGGGGMAGMAWRATLVPVREFDSETFPVWAGWDALELARTGAPDEKSNRLGRPSHRIVNCSWGQWPPDLGNSDQEPGNVAAINRQGNIVVAAVGNKCKAADPACSPAFCSSTQYVFTACHSVWEPAMLPGVIGVGQSDGDCEYDGMAGPEVALVAPSARTLSSWPLPADGGPPTFPLYANGKGTSFASPMVAGVAACLVDQNPDWYGETVRRRVRQTAHQADCPSERTCNQCSYEQENGAGRLDAYAALGGPPGGPGCDWLYLSDSRSVLDATALEDFRYHLYPTYVGGPVTFQVTIANPAKLTDGLDVAAGSLRVGVTRPDGTSAAPVSNCAATFTSSSSTVTTWSIGTYAPDTNYSYNEAFHTATVFVMDTNGHAYAIPAPAIVVAGDIPASVTAEVLTPAPNACGPITIRVRAFDAGGHLVTEAPIIAWLADAPVPQTGQPTAKFSAAYPLSATQLTGGSSAPWTDFVLYPSARVGPYTVQFCANAACTTTAFATVPCSPAKAVITPQFDAIIAGATEEIRAHLEDQWGNTVTSVDPTRFCLSQATANGGGFLGPSAIGADGILRQMYRPDPGGKCDLLVAALDLLHCGSGNTQMSDSVTVCPAEPARIDVRTAPDRVPAGGSVQLLISALSRTTSGLVVGGVTVRATIGPIPPGATAFVSDYYADWMSKVSVTVLSDSPAETTIVLHTGDRTGTYYVTVSLPAYPGATPFQVGVVATRDWPQWRRDQSQNPLALGDILKPPLKLMWEVNALGVPAFNWYWSPVALPTSPLMDGGMIFAPYQFQLAAMNPANTLFMTSRGLPDAGGILAFGPAAEPLFGSGTQVWMVSHRTQLERMNYGPGGFAFGPIRPILAGKPLGLYATVADGPSVIEANLDNGVLAMFDETDLLMTQRWSYTRPKLGDGWNTPAVACGRIFLPHGGGGIQMISAFDVRTGDVRWSATLGAARIILSPPLAIRDLATGRLRVIVYLQDSQASYQSALVCLDGLTGSQLWRTNMPQVLNTSAAPPLNLNLTVADRGRVYFMYNNTVLPWDPSGIPSLRQWLLRASLADGSLDPAFSVTLSGDAQGLVAANGFLYVTEGGAAGPAPNALRIYRGDTGEMVDRHDFIGGGMLGLAVTNTMVLAQTYDGTVHAWGAGVNCPRNVRGRAQGPALLVQWDPPVEATYAVTAYRILRSTSAEAPQTELGRVSWASTAYLDTPPDCGIAYYYQVMALDTEGHESERCVLVPLKGPGAQLIAFSLSVTGNLPFDCVGQTRAVKLTVRNDGLFSASRMTGSLSIVQGSATVITYGSYGTFTPLTLTPGGTGTITWQVKATGGGDLVLRGSASGIDACSATVVSSATIDLGPIDIRCASLYVTAAAPSFVHPGMTFTVTITAYNAGTEVAISVTPTAKPAYASPWVVIYSPQPHLVAQLDPGATAYFTIQMTAKSPGRLVLDPWVMAKTCHYAVKYPGASVTVFIGAAKLAIVAAVASPAGVCPGGVVTATFTVSNTGDGAATGVRGATPLALGTGSVAYGGAPPVVIGSLAPGSTTGFSFTYTAVGSGTASFRSLALGYDVASGAFLTSTAATTNTMRISDNTMTVAVAGSGPGTVGATIFVVETVTNTSGVSAFWVKPALVVSGPSAVMVSSPSPSSVTLLGDGASRAFTWRYRVDSWGVLKLGASATATICATALTFTGTGGVLVGHALLAGTSLAVSPSPPCPNQTFQVILGVENRGDGGAVNVTPGVPALWVLSGTPSASVVVPASPLPSLPPGASGAFTWTYQAGPGTGTLKVVAGASWTDAVSLQAASFYPLVSDAVEVSRGLVATVSVPGTVTRGVPFPLVLTFSNVTSSPAYVSPNPMDILAGGGLIASQTGPVPAGTFTVTPGGSQAFTWTFVTNGMGVVAFNPSVAATVCGVAGGAGPGETYVTSFNGAGDWLTWGHDAQHTFRQAEATPLEPPLEEIWSVRSGTSPIVAGSLSYWVEPDNTGYYNRLVARRILDGGEVWHASGLFMPTATATDGNVVYVINSEGGRHVSGYDTMNGQPLPNLYPPYGVENLTVDGGNLYVVSSAGLSIYRQGTIFTRPVTAFAGVKTLLTSPPLVVNGSMVVIGLSASGGKPHLILSGPSASFNVEIDLAPTYGPNTNYMTFDGSLIVVTGANVSGAVVKAYNPVNGWEVRSFTWPYGGEIYGPALADSGDVVARRVLPWSTAQGVGYSPSASLRLIPSGGSYTVSTRNEPLWWSDFGPYAGRSAVANGFVYHAGENAALNRSGVNSHRTIVHAVDLADNGIVWSSTSDWQPAGMRAPAVARGLLFMDGGHVWGPRTIDPPADLTAASVLRGAFLAWSPPAMGAADVLRYELYRAETTKGQIWAGAFANPGVTPPPVLVASTTALTFTDTGSGLVPGRTYWYAVRAVTRSGRPATSWFSPEVDVMAGGPVALISSPDMCTIAPGSVPVYGKAYYLGTPNLFSRYVIAVDGTAWITSYTAKGIPQTGPVYLGSVPVPASGCHTITLTVYATDGTGESTTVTVGGNFGIVCAGCGGPNPVVTFSEHRHPEGISTDAADFVYVVDSLRRRIERFDAQGRLLWELGKPDASGKDPAGLKAPVAAVVGPDGSLYVADKLRKQVVVYDEDGGFRYAFGGNGDAPGRFREPSGITLDATGRLWVADRLTGKLQLFTRDGTYLATVAGTGAAPLKEPAHLWAEPSGTVWVADAGNDRACAFDQEGRLIRTVGAAGELARPSGVAVDASGRRLFVGDTGHDRISAFDADTGSFLFSFGTPGGAVGEMRQPGGLALDTQTSCLYVADTLNDRGQRWPLRLSVAPDLIRPRAELGELPATSVERGVMVIVRGRAVDAHFSRYRLTLKGAGTTSMLVDSGEPVWLGELGRLKTAAFLPGSYELELVVEDAAGNMGRASRFLMIAPKPEPLVVAPHR